MLLNKILNLIDRVSFKYQTTFLIFVITTGMFSVILLSQVSIYSLKNDFDFLLEKRTKPIIKLEAIKDTFTINIYDTLYDIQKNNITVIQSRDVIVLGQQLINKNWRSYKKTTLESTHELSFVTKIIKNIVLHKKNNYNKKLQTNIINNIDKKIKIINRKINTIFRHYQRNEKKEANKLITNINFDINSINIYIANLTNFDLNLAIEEKINTQKVFNVLSFVLNIFVLFVFIFSILLSMLIIANFRKSHSVLEDAVNNKTKELQKLNESLENRIKKEVANSRKKDMLMFQQARLASLGEMISNIAHQWRQPLGSIMMIVQSFQTKMSLGKLTQSFVDQKVLDAILLADNMSNTLEDFQNFFKPNKDKTNFEVKNCIEHSLELSKYILKQENIEIELLIKDNPRINGFYNELSHVILNIISNSKDALKNREKNKLIKIILKCQDQSIYIKIYDNGGGINEIALPQIFEPYYTTKYKSAGTGIGLYMSKQIIEKHMSGNIKCKNIYYNINKSNFEQCALFIIKIPKNKV